MIDGLFVIVLSTIILASAYLWFKLAQNFKGYLSVDSSSLPPGRPFGLLDVAIMFFVWGLGSLAAMQIGAWIGWYELVDDLEALKAMPMEQQTAITFMQGLGLLISTVLAMIVIRLRYSNEGPPFGLSFSRLNDHLLLTLKAFAMVLPLLLGIQMLCGLLVEYKHDTLELLRENFTMKTGLATWFTAVVVAPIAEEVFFRGLLQAWLQRLMDSPNSSFDAPMIIGGWSPAERKSVEQSPGTVPQKPVKLTQQGENLSFWIPIVISSFLFGMAHFGQGLAPIPLFFFAIALGYLYRATGSLIPCIALHFLLNAFTMFWMTMQLIS